MIDSWGANMPPESLPGLRTDKLPLEELQSLYRRELVQNTLLGFGTSSCSMVELDFSELVKFTEGFGE